VTTLVPHAEGVPLPQPTKLSQPFWDGCARDELLFQRCTACGRALFNPVPICRWCRSSALAWERSRGRGTVYSWSVAWRPASPAFAVPYAVAIVDLDEGYQMLANIIGCEPEDLHVGMAVTVEFHPVGGGTKLAYFRPS
jgi:uncharacterized OB-fold protein